MSVTLSLIAAALCVATLLPWLPAAHWSMRGADFPRLQIALLAAVCCALATLSLDLSSRTNQLVLAALLTTLAVQLAYLLPYSPLWPRQVPDAGTAEAGHRLRLLVSNVLTSNRNAEALIAAVRRERPDLLIALETDDWWEAQLDQLGDLLPHALRCPQDNLYGMHVFSRQPIEDGSVRFLVEADVPSMHLSVRIEDETAVRMHVLHPAPPSPTENEESAPRDAELLAVGRSLEDDTGPVIVVGDLNATPWSRATRLFLRSSGLRDPRIGRAVLSTFDANRWWMRWPLDHVFCSTHFGLVGLRRLENVGSDHFPLLVELALPGTETGASEHADAADRASIDALLREQNAHAGEVPAPGRDGH